MDFTVVAGIVVTGAAGARSMLPDLRDEDFKRRVYSIWRECFRELEEFGVPYRFGPRQLSGLYGVASICYYGNDESPIPDCVYDKLCEWLLRNLPECKAAGADLLDEQLLRCHSGFKLRQFVKPYHDIAAVLLGHSCNCGECCHGAVGTVAKGLEAKDE
jgi:hypothetical protein